MKRILPAILATVMMIALSACDTKEAEQTETTSAEVTAETVSETTSALTEESKTETSETESVGEAAISVMAVKKDGEIIPSPDDDFLRRIFSGDFDTIVFTLDSSGKYSAYDADQLYANSDRQMMYDFANEILSGEYYEKNKEYFENEVSSYEEYMAMVEEYLGDELREYLEYEPEETEPLAYFIVESYSYIDEDKTSAYSDEQIFIRAAGRLFECINENPEIAEKITGCFESGESFYAATIVYYEGKDFMKVYTGFADSTNNYFNGEFFCDIEESISVDGRKGIVLNDTFVPADTEKLFLTYSDQFTVEAVADEIIPEDCVIVCNSYKTSERNDDLIYDLKDISEKLPELKELYLYMARVTNTEYIAEMKGLESLCYNALVPVDGEDYYNFADDTPFKELPKLKNLWLYGNYADYSFLNDMPGLEDAFVSIDTWRKAEDLPYDSVFDCPVVTGFEVEINNDLTGLDKLTNLQHLHLTYGWVSMGGSATPLDISVVKELKNLTCLEISASGYDIGELSELIGDPSKLENLELVRVKTTKDWSFLSQLTALKNLDLFEIPYVSDKDIEQMPWLESLSWYDTDIDSSIYDKMPNLKKE